MQIFRGYEIQILPTDDVRIAVTQFVEDIDRTNSKMTYTEEDGCVYVYTHDVGLVSDLRDRIQGAFPYRVSVTSRYNVFHVEDWVVLPAD